MNHADKSVRATFFLTHFPEKILSLRAGGKLAEVRHGQP